MTYRWIYSFTKKVGILMCIGVFLLLPGMSSVHAQITQEELQSILDGYPHYDPNEAECDPDSTSTLIGNDNIQKAFNFFILKGLTPEQSAGIVGNLRQESQVNPSSNNSAAQPSSVSPSSIIPGLDYLGGGIAQWEDSNGIPGRWTGPDGYLNYVKDLNEDLSDDLQKPWDDLGTQLDFIWHEMPNQYAYGKLGELQAILPQATPDTSSLEAVQMSETYEIAAQAWELTYERAGDPRMENRIQYAGEVLAQYGNSAPGATDPTSGCGGAGVIVGNYSFPLAPQTKRNYSNVPCNASTTTYTDDYGRSSQVQTCHHDGSPAFDLSYADVDNKAVYAITNGIIEWVRPYGTCNSIAFRADTPEDQSWYWYGHIVAQGVSSGKPVSVGDAIGYVAGSDDHNSSCYASGPHLHIDRGCIIGNYTKADNGVAGVRGPQPGGTPPDNGFGNGGCREPGFLEDLKAIWEALPEE